MTTDETLGKYYDPATGFASSVSTARNALNTKQEGQESDYLTRFRQAIMGQEGLPHMYQRIGDELNLPNLATNFNQVSNTMTNLPETYSKGTRGFDVNANQLGRIVSTKQAALAPALTTATQNYGTALNERDKMITAGQTQQEKELQPFKTEQDFLTDRWARESTGFTNDMGKELDTILAKAQAGITLTSEELNRANQLAIAEKNYQTAVKTKQMEIDAQSKYAPVPNTSGLYNVQTGKKTGWG